MAEGLDGAAQAFAQEISPGSDRPRDESGRFSSTAQRPEPLFQSRPLEGDEKTGDTRDGGEDTLLAARERRIADGWLDEGSDGENGTHDPAKRPPKLKGRVANDVYSQTARSAVMPPPTKDTQEPRMSRAGMKAKSPTMKGTKTPRAGR